MSRHRNSSEKASANMSPMSNYGAPAYQERAAQGIILCPRCFLPVDPNQHQSGGECELHGRCIHPPCAMKAGGSSCLFCRHDIKLLGRLGVVKLICERMVEATEDLELQLRGQAAMLAIARNGPHEIKTLEECRGISIAMANVNNRGHPALLKHGMELLCVVSQVPYQGLDAQGFTAACHAVSREVRKFFVQGSSSPQGEGGKDAGQAQGTDPLLRNIVMSACVGLAGLSVTLALTLTDLKLVEVLVKQLQPTGDPQAQVESIAILTGLSAHKTVAPRLVASKVHTAALRLLPMPASNLAPSPVLTATSPMSPQGQKSPTRKGPKTTYVVSLLADLCEHGAPHEDMQADSALCTRLVRGVLQPNIDDHEISAQCTRVIVAVAAASDSCAEALGVEGACESLTTLLGRASLPRDTLVNVLDGIYWMCTASDSSNKDRFAVHEAAQKVVKGFVSLCATMRASADPVLICCFLRAMRGLATHHRANAEALGQYAIMHIKELSRNSKDDLDLVSECGAALSALNGALANRSSASAPSRSHSKELDQSAATSEAGTSVDGSGGSEDNMRLSIAEDDEVEDEELTYTRHRQFTKSSLPSLVRGSSKSLTDIGVGGQEWSLSLDRLRSSSNAAHAIAKMKSKRLQTLEKLSQAPLTSPQAVQVSLLLVPGASQAAYSDAEISRSLPTQLMYSGSSSRSLLMDPPTTARGAATLQRQSSISPKPVLKTEASRRALPILDTAGASASMAPSGLGTARTGTARITTARTGR